MKLILTAQDVIDGLREIEDRAYSMQYYKQKLRSAQDCRRIELASRKDRIKLLESYANPEPDGKIIEGFLQWAINNELIYFDHLLYHPEDVNVTFDVAEKLIIEYLTKG